MEQMMEWDLGDKGEMQGGEGEGDRERTHVGAVS